MLDSVTGVELKGSTKIGSIPMVIFCSVMGGFGSLAAIVGILSSDFGMIVVGSIFFIISIVLFAALYYLVAIIGHSNIYILNQKRRILIASDLTPDLREIKKAIDAALIKNKT